MTQVLEPKGTQQAHDDTVSVTVPIYGDNPETSLVRLAFLKIAKQSHTAIEILENYPSIRKGFRGRMGVYEASEELSCALKLSLPSLKDADEFITNLKYETLNPELGIIIE